VKDGHGDDGTLEQWISYLENLVCEKSKNLIDTIEDGEQLNALHMAVMTNNEDVLKKFIYKFDAGTNSFAYSTSYYTI